jgi:osmotically-inducible protein OsmY
VTTLDLAVRGGKATVRGLISDEDELDAIKETIGEMRAISDLSCLVQVAPERQERERDRARRIQESLDSEPDLAAQNIQVAWVAHKAILRGTARSELEKAKAGLMALRLGGASHVRNRLVVTG